MKQTLQLKLSQHLTLTPQLQQSIRLLQLSTIELNAEVERMLQENPLLERTEPEDERAVEIPLSGPGRVGDQVVERTREVASSDESDSRGSRDDAPEPSDFSDYGSGGDSDWGGGNGSDDDDFLPQQVATSTLRDHLNGQLALLNLPLRDRQIVTALIDALDDDGYLTQSLEEIAALLTAEAGADPEALALAILRILEQPDFASRLAQAGQARVRRDFSFDRLTSQLEALYQGPLALSCRRTHLASLDAATRVGH